MQRQIDEYEKGVTEVEKQRKEILANARQEAKELLAQSNKQIENAIREIREEQAEKEATKKIRAELEQFKQDVDEGTWKKPGKRSSGILSDEDFQKKVAQIQARKQRHEQRKKDKQAEEQQAAKVLRDTLGKRHQDAKREIVVGDAVRMRGIQSQGRVEALDGNTATVIFGDMRTKVFEPADINR